MEVRMSYSCVQLCDMLLYVREIKPVHSCRSSCTEPLKMQVIYYKIQSSHIEFGSNIVNSSITNKILKNNFMVKSGI